MSQIRLNVYRLRKTILFVKSNPVETSFTVILILSTLAPLRCPTIRGYTYLDLPDIKDDLQMCLVTRRPHEFKLCPLVARDSGMAYIPILRIFINVSTSIPVFKTGIQVPVV